MIRVEFVNAAVAKRYYGGEVRKAYPNAYLGQQVTKGRYKYYRLWHRHTHELVADLFVDHVKWIRTQR